MSTNDKFGGDFHSLSQRAVSPESNSHVNSGITSSKTISRSKIIEVFLAQKKKREKDFETTGNIFATIKSTHAEVLKEFTDFSFLPLTSLPENVTLEQALESLAKVQQSSHTLISTTQDTLGESNTLFINAVYSSFLQQVRVEIQDLFDPMHISKVTIARLYKEHEDALYPEFKKSYDAYAQTAATDKEMAELLNEYSQLIKDKEKAAVALPRQIRKSDFINHMTALIGISSQFINKYKNTKHHEIFALIKKYETRSLEMLTKSVDELFDDLTKKMTGGEKVVRIDKSVLDALQKRIDDVEFEKFRKDPDINRRSKRMLKDPVQAEHFRSFKAFAVAFDKRMDCLPSSFSEKDFETYMQDIRFLVQEYKGHLELLSDKKYARLLRRNLEERLKTMEAEIGKHFEEGKKLQGLMLTSTPVTIESKEKSKTMPIQIFARILSDSNKTVNDQHKLRVLEQGADDFNHDPSQIKLLEQFDDCLREVTNLIGLAPDDLTKDQVYEFLDRLKEANTKGEVFIHKLKYLNVREYFLRLNRDCIRLVQQKIDEYFAEDSSVTNGENLTEKKEFTVKSQVLMEKFVHFAQADDAEWQSKGMTDRWDRAAQDATQKDLLLAYTNYRKEVVEDLQKLPEDLTFKDFEAFHVKWARQFVLCSKKISLLADKTLSNFLISSTANMIHQVVLQIHTQFGRPILNAKTFMHYVSESMIESEKGEIGVDYIQAARRANEIPSQKVLLDQVDDLGTQVNDRLKKIPLQLVREDALGTLAQIAPLIEETFKIASQLEDQLLGVNIAKRRRAAFDNLKQRIEEYFEPRLMGREFLRQMVKSIGAENVGNNSEAFLQEFQKSWDTPSEQPYMHAFNEASSTTFVEIDKLPERVSFEEAIGVVRLQMNRLEAGRLQLNQLKNQRVAKTLYDLNFDALSRVEKLIMAFFTQNSEEENNPVQISKRELHEIVKTLTQKLNQEEPEDIKKRRKKAEQNSEDSGTYYSFLQVDREIKKELDSLPENITSYQFTVLIHESIIRVKEYKQSLNQMKDKKLARYLYAASIAHLKEVEGAVNKIFEERKAEKTSNTSSILSNPTNLIGGLTSNHVPMLCFDERISGGDRIDAKEKSSELKISAEEYHALAGVTQAPTMLDIIREYGKGAQMPAFVKLLKEIEEQNRKVTEFWKNLSFPLTEKQIVAAITSTNEQQLSILRKQTNPELEELCQYAREGIIIYNSTIYKNIISYFRSRRLCEGKTDTYLEPQRGMHIDQVVEIILEASRKADQKSLHGVNTSHVDKKNLTRFEELIQSVVIQNTPPVVRSPVDVKELGAWLFGRASGMGTVAPDWSKGHTGIREDNLESFAKALIEICNQLPIQDSGLTPENIYSYCLLPHADNSNIFAVRRDDLVSNIIANLEDSKKRILSHKNGRKNLTNEQRGLFIQYIEKFKKELLLHSNQHFPEAITSVGPIGCLDAFLSEIDHSINIWIQDLDGDNPDLPKILARIQNEMSRSYGSIILKAVDYVRYPVHVPKAMDQDSLATEEIGTSKTISQTYPSPAIMRGSILEEVRFASQSKEAQTSANIEARKTFWKETTQRALQAVASKFIAQLQTSDISVANEEERVKLTAHIKKLFAELTARLLRAAERAVSGSSIPHGPEISEAFGDVLMNFTTGGVLGDVEDLFDKHIIGELFDFFADSDSKKFVQRYKKLGPVLHQDAIAGLSVLPIATYQESATDVQKMQTALQNLKNHYLKDLLHNILDGTPKTSRDLGGGNMVAVVHQRDFSIIWADQLRRAVDTAVDAAVAGSQRGKVSMEDHLNNVFSPVRQRVLFARICSAAKKEMQSLTKHLVPPEFVFTNMSKGHAPMQIDCLSVVEPLSRDQIERMIREKLLSGRSAHTPLLPEERESLEQFCKTALQPSEGESFEEKLKKNSQNLHALAREFNTSFHAGLQIRSGSLNAPGSLGQLAQAIGARMAIQKGNAPQRSISRLADHLLPPHIQEIATMVDENGEWIESWPHSSKEDDDLLGFAQVRQWHTQSQQFVEHYRAYGQELFPFDKAKLDAESVRDIRVKKIVFVHENETNGKKGKRVLKSNSKKVPAFLIGRQEKEAFIKEATGNTEDSSMPPEIRDSFSALWELGRELQRLEEKQNGNSEISEARIVELTKKITSLEEDILLMEDASTSASSFLTGREQFVTQVPQNAQALINYLRSSRAVSAEEMEKTKSDLAKSIKQESDDRQKLQDYTSRGGKDGDMLKKLSDALEYSSITVAGLNMHMQSFSPERLKNLENLEQEVMKAARSIVPTFTAKNSDANVDEPDFEDLQELVTDFCKECSEIIRNRNEVVEHSAQLPKSKAELEHAKTQLGETEQQDVMDKKSQKRLDQIRAAFAEVNAKLAPLLSKKKNA